jgi:glycosyltransferase involved in cell wall biosynthesis
MGRRGGFRSALTIKNCVSGSVHLPDSSSRFRVLIDARRHANSGVGRVGQWLARNVPVALGERFDCCVLVSSQTAQWAAELSGVECIETPILPFSDAEFTDLPRYVESLGFDLYINPQSTWSPEHRTPTINCIHDVWALKNPAWLPSRADIEARFSTGKLTFQHQLAEWLDEDSARQSLTATGFAQWAEAKKSGHLIVQAAWAQYAAVLQQSRHVVVVSHFLLDEVDERFQAGARRSVITNCPLPFVSQQARQPRHFVCLSKIEPRKNLHYLLDAYESYVGLVGAGSALPLIMAGDAGYAGVSQVFRARVEQLGAAGLPVEFRSAVDDAELTRLFAGAAALVSPSLFEGFGFPPMEAMLSGVPVIAVRTGVLTGPLGERVVAVDGVDSGALAQAQQAAQAQVHPKAIGMAWSGLIQMAAAGSSGRRPANPG